MPIDFRKLAIETKAKFDAQRRIETDKRAEEAIVHDEKIEEGFAVLRVRILPLLNQAVEAFKAEGIDALVVEGMLFRGLGHIAMYWFRLRGPLRESDGFQLEIPGAFFSSDGHNIYVGVAQATYDAQPTKDVGFAEQSERVEELVASALQQALAAYYRETQVSYW